MLYEVITKLDDEEEISNRGPFVASFIAFFLAEIGDKTQIATSILGAQYARITSYNVCYTKLLRTEFCSPPSSETGEQREITLPDTPSSLLQQ